MSTKKTSVVSRPLSQPIHDAVHLAAGKYTYMHSLWLRQPEQLASMSLDENYDPTKRFDSVVQKLQGQLRELYEVIPETYHGEFFNSVFWKEVSIFLVLATRSSRRYLASSSRSKCNYNVQQGPPVSEWV